MTIPETNWNCDACAKEKLAIRKNFEVLSSSLGSLQISYEYKIRNLDLGEHTNISQTV